MISGSVASSDTLLGDFRWAPVASTTLGIGTYVIGGVAGADEWQYTGSTSVGDLTFDPRVTYDAARATLSNVLTFPEPNTGALYSYFGPNFGTSDAPPVPEPATLALLGIGLAGFGFSRRKRTS